MEKLTALSVFILTLFLVIKKPKGVDIGWSATFGAILSLLFGVVSIDDVYKVVEIVWDPTLAFIGIIFISLILDKIGFFEWAALHIIHFSKGDGVKLFLYLILLGAGISAFFANDGAALILTPIVYQKIKHLGLSQRYMLPYIMGSGFVADTTSLPLIISNLVNILTADIFKIGFFEYASVMIFVNFFSLVATIMALYLYFRKDILKRVDLEAIEDKPPKYAIKDRFLFKLSWLVFLVLLVGFFVAEHYHIPIFMVIGIGAFILGVATYKKEIVDMKTLVLKETPWKIVIFSIGMYVVVYSLKNTGFTDFITYIIKQTTSISLDLGIVATGFLAALLSSVMNNLPSVMVVNLSILDTGFDIQTMKYLAYANVVGCDLGPKITPIGSLATLLWLYVLNQKGIHISWGYYFKVGVVLTLPTLLITLIGLILTRLI
ncbi:arsenic transporter [Sulfurihydrogenibium azorense]|uniref:arsenic transporter n=1 Tax=Sulfurihydrogenibium azorense TaxID=309806 RepID=UPI00391AF5DF